MNNEEYLKKLYGVKEEVKAPKPVQSEGANNEEYLNNLFGVQTETPKVEEKKGPGLLSRAASTIANIGPAVFDAVTKFDPIEALGNVGKQTLEAARAQHSSVKATNKALAPLLVPQKPTNEWSDPRDAGTQSKLGLVGGAITTTTPFQEGVGEALDMRPILNEAYRLWQAGDLYGMTRLASGNFIDLQGASDTGLRKAISAISSTEGGPIKAASELAKAVPFFGPMAEQVEVLLKEGQYAKAAGLSLGIIAPFGVHAIGGKIAFKPEKMAQAVLDAHRIYAWDARSLRVEEARIKKMPDGPEKTKAIEHLEVVRQGKMAAAVREAAIKLLDKEKSEAINKRVRGERKKKAPEAAKPVEEKTVEAPAKTSKKKRAAKAKTEEAKTETPETPIEEPVDAPLVTAKEIAKIKALTAQGLDPGQIAFKLDIAEAEIRKVIGEKKASDGTKIIQTEEPVSGGSDTIITPDELKAIEKHFGPDWDEIPTEQLDKWVEDLRKGEADTSEFTAKVVEVADDALDIEALQKEIDAELAGEKDSFRGAFKKDERKIGEFDSEAALTEAEAKLRKLRDEEITSEQIVDEALEDVDIATGSKDPVMEPVDDVVSPFRTEKDVTAAQANNYRRSVLVAEDFAQLTDQSTPKSVLVTTHKLVNDINRVLDGDRTVNIQNTREFLSEVAARADEFEWEFMDESGIVDATAFNEWKQFTQDSAKWARNAGMPDGLLYDGNQFNLFVDPSRLSDLLKKVINDELNQIKANNGSAIRADILWRKTGLFRNPYDHKWRFEIDDSQVTWKTDFRQLEETTFLGGPSKYKLPDVLDHPTLYQLYPELADVVFSKEPKLMDYGKTTHGWFDPVENTLVVTPYADAPRKTILHEIQHWIQRKEGFAQGGSVESAIDFASPRNLVVFIEKAKEGLDQSLRYFDHSINSNLRQIRNLNMIRESPELQKAIKQFRDADNQIGDLWVRLGEDDPRKFYRQPEVVELDLLKTQAERAIKDITDFDTGELAELINVYEPNTPINALIRQYETSTNSFRGRKDEVLLKKRELDTLPDDQVKAKLKESAEASFEAYKSLAGEIEARDVAARADLDPTHRRMTLPLSSEVFKSDQVIVRFDSPNQPSVKSSGTSLYSGVPLDKVGDVMQQWYSGLRDYANKKLGGKASGQQIKATLRKGSTADEWKQVQLDEMLEDGKSYSKAEVLAIIDENKMEFEDVVLSQDKAPKVIQTGPDSFRINTDDPVYGPNFFTREAAERRLHDVRRSRDYVDGEPKFSPYVEPGGKNYVELFVTAPEVKISPHTENLSKAQWIAEGSVGDWPRPSKTTWRDGHVDYDVIENPIVRLRMNDRVGPNGEKVLFIEELQGPNKDNQAMMPEALRKRIREIGMKRAIKYALDGGYDRVAWTTGEMQANRYSLDKHIDGISWTKYKNVKGDDVVDIAVSSKNGDYTDYIVKPEDLKNYIGEELANKVNSGETSGELTGLDLKFKEPGLRKLYDQDLPNVAKKLGGKVEDSKVNFALTQAELQIANRIHYYAVRDRLTGETYGPEFKSFEEADAYIKSGVWKERGLNEKTVQSFSVKPFEARKDVGFTFYSGVDPVAAYKSVMKYMDDARGVKDFKPKEALKMVKESFIRKIVDTSGNLREDFISVLGQDGYRMIQAMYLSKGAGSRSSKMYRQMEKEVFGGLNSKEQQLLDALILNDRLVAISKTPRGKGFKYPKGLELKKAQAFVENFEAAAGIAPERALTIRQRAQAYADWMRKPLKDLYESDIIGTKEFEDLLISNYRRIQLAEIFDRENPTLKGHKRSVYDSGVETLQKGKKSDIYEPSSRIVALEVFNRAYGRIANNNANLELLHLAKSNPSNPFARIREKGVESVTELESTRRKILDSIMIKRDRLGMSDYEFRSMVKEKTKTSSLSRLNNEQLTQIEAELGDGHFKYNIKKLPDDQKIPKGWGTVYVYEGGVRRPIRVSPQLMKEWITSSPEISYKYAQMLRWASGSNVLRTFATGINWSFAVKNIPRDIMHIWFSARQMTGGKWTSTYSTLMPKFGVQMGTDLAGTFKDALTRGPKWVKFIDEGGGMEWLAHQGRLFQKGRHIEGWADKAYDFLGYFGETSEIWTRLALRDRVIKNRARELGISYQEAAKRPEISKEATFVARDYMDFSQGGSFTKAADAGIPYLNATIQGTRGLLRSFKRDTALQSTMKLAQLGALVTGIYIARRVMAPEAHQQLRGEIDDVNNLVIPLPESLAYEDEHGQKVYQYLKIPMDSGQKFFKAVFEASVDQWYGEEVDYNKIKNAFEALSPVGLSSLPPTINSAIVYLANKDLWTGRDVWRGEGGALPYPNSKEEYIPGRTPQAAIDLGQITGVSPERGLAALQKLIPKNIWGTLLGAGYEWLSDVPESQRQRTLSEALHNVPEWKSIIGVTNPYSQWASKISTERDKDRAERLRQNNEIDSLIRGNLIEGNVTSEEIDDRIFRYEDRKVRDRLKDRVKFAEKTYDLPNYSFWMSMRGLPVNVRAEVYTYRIKNSTPEQLAILDEEEAAVRRIEKRLKSSQFSIFTDEFKKEVRKLGY